MRPPPPAVASAPAASVIKLLHQWRHLWQRGKMQLSQTTKGQATMLTLRQTDHPLGQVDLWLHIMLPERTDLGDVFIQVTNGVPDTLVAHKHYTMVDADLSMPAVDIQATVRVVAEPELSHEVVARTIINKGEEAIALAMAQWGLEAELGEDVREGECWSCGQHRVLVPYTDVCVTCLYGSE